jgi:hypothetical protein
MQKDATHEHTAQQYVTDNPHALSVVNELQPLNTNNKN